MQLTFYGIFNKLKKKSRTKASKWQIDYCFRSNKISHKKIIGEKNSILPNFGTVFEEIINENHNVIVDLSMP